MNEFAIRPLRVVKYGTICSSRKTIEIEKQNVGAYRYFNQTDQEETSASHIYILKTLNSRPDRAIVACKC